MWGISAFKDHKFNFYNLNFIDFIRLFFSYDVKSIYKEIFYMANQGLNPDYILKISPSERRIYSAIIEEKRKLESNQDGYNYDKIGKKISSEVEELALEFGDTVPK